MTYHLQLRDYERIAMENKLDIQEQTRRDDIYNDLNEIVDKITTLPVFPSLLWVWTFDVLRNIYENNRYEDLAVNDYVDEAVPAGITLKQIFDKFWEDVDGIGLSMDLGDEIIDETIRDWMRENDFLVALDEDGWLDDEEEEDATD
jgi:hypothetical protein